MTKPPPTTARTARPVPGPKDLVWLDTTNHIGLDDVPAYVEPAVERLATWFDQHPSPAT